MCPKKILLAEDDADDREVFMDFLKGRTDITLLTAVENGEEVLDYFSSMTEALTLPDLIILDQNMPKKNGIQTLHSVKQYEILKGIPVFIYSTYADELLYRQSMEAGASMVYSKPYTFEGYQEMIDRMLLVISS